MKQDIQNRTDIELLVHTFYAKIRKNEEIGHFFNTMIQDWDAHLVKLSDFWETILFHTAQYKGNPAIAHIKTATHFNHSIEQEHFDTWIRLWRETHNELFEGPISSTAVERAEMIAEVQFNMLKQYKNKTV